MRAETHRLFANGISHFVRDSGELSAPVAVLLHGFPDSSRVWEKVTPFLTTAGFRIIAPDMRGFGETDMASSLEGYDIETGAVKDVLELLKCLKINQAHIVGHDFGSPVAWMLAAHHPGTFKTLSAISVGHTHAYLKAGWEQKWRSAYILFHQCRGLCETAYRFNDWTFLRKHWSSHGDIEDAIRLLSRPGRLTAGLNWYRQNISIGRILKPPPLGAFGEETVRIPTLGIWSDGEAYLTEKQMTLSSAFVDAPWRYERINGASHWVSYDAPALLARYLISHWRAYV